MILNFDVTSHSFTALQTINMKALRFLLALITIYNVFAVEEECPPIIDRICVATDVPSLNIQPYLWFASQCFFEKTQRLGINNFGKIFYFGKTNITFFPFSIHGNSE